MPTFVYTARDKSGAIKKGNVIALDQQAAAGNLIEKGLVPILIKDQHQAKGKGLGLNPMKMFGMGNRVSLEDKVVFSRQFATMINAGVPITQSLQILQKQTSNTYFKGILGAAAKKVEGGSTLSAALAEHPKVFSAIYVNMVKAGEAGGLLDEVLERLAVQQEKDAEIVGKVKSALIYPAILTLVTIGAFIFLMVYLVPRMAAIFDSLGSDIPWYSKMMLSMSYFFVHYGIFLLVGAVAGAVFLVRFIKTPRGRHIWDTIMIKAPIIGPITVKMNVARFARTLGSLMASGLSVLEALNTTASALGNTVYRDSLFQIAKQVKAGKNISEPIKEMEIFPPIVSQMVAVGEETGQLDQILTKLAGFYEKEVDTTVAGLTSVIEPILIVVLGGVVGFVVIGVYGPLSSLTKAI